MSDDATHGVFICFTPGEKQTIHNAFTHNISEIHTLSLKRAQTPSHLPLFTLTKRFSLPWTQFSLFSLAAYCKRTALKFSTRYENLGRKLCLVHVLTFSISLTLVCVKGGWWEVILSCCKATKLQRWVFLRSRLATYEQMHIDQDNPNNTLCALFVLIHHTRWDSGPPRERRNVNISHSPDVSLHSFGIGWEANDAQYIQAQHIRDSHIFDQSDKCGSENVTFHTFRYSTHSFNMYDDFLVTGSIRHCAQWCVLSDARVWYHSHVSYRWCMRNIAFSTLP